MEQIDCDELTGPDRPIPRFTPQVTAFIGRTLRGPLNAPVRVCSFAEYQQHFGGLWQPSPLSYAVEHFFEQGGQQAVIVRVANGATPATLSLRCGTQWLHLEACAPGTREFLRASIDYDQLDPADALLFNLVVQRVRTPGSERIEAQESFRALSVDRESPRYIATVLLQSELVRMRGDAPSRRPDRTLMPGTNLPVGYVSSNPDGDDGQAITDYDVIGSAARGAGLYALQAIEDLAFVYIPPLSRTHEVGASTLLAAQRVCRRKRAMLIVDPPVAWDNPAEAVRSAKALELRSEHAVMFYPRIVAMDRLRGQTEIFGNGGAVAGVLSRSGEVVAAAIAAHDPEPLLRAHARLAREVSSSDQWTLNAHGVNVLQSTRAPGSAHIRLRTLACGASASADGSYLTPRRFASYVINAIELGTRWSAARAADPNTWFAVQAQVHRFLLDLHQAGALGAMPLGQAFTVICDERINTADAQPPAVNLLVQFAARNVGDYHSFMLTHSLSGCEVKPVAVNRLEASFAIDPELRRESTLKLRPDLAAALLAANAN